MPILRPQTLAELDAALRGVSAVLEVSIPHCAMCESAESALEKLSAYFPRVAFIQVNAASDAFEFLLDTRGIRTVPTLLFLCDGVELARDFGAVPTKVIRQKIETYLSGGRT